MVITKKRIRKAEKYLSAVKDGDIVILGIPSVVGLDEKLESCGFSAPITAGDTVLPTVNGPVSGFNANGKTIVHRDQPMETAYRQAEWRWTEFRGRYDTEEMSRIVEIPYDRYPRSLVPPPSIELTIVDSPAGGLAVIAPEMTKDSRLMDMITHTINLLLECFGECHVMDSSLMTIGKMNMRRLNWEILPPGKIPWSKLQGHLKPLLEKQPSGNQKVITERFESINKYEPPFTAFGKAGFQGYIVFGFPDSDLYVLESTEVNNATYILGSDWETISAMTKAEILNASLHKERVIHRENWFHQMDVILHEVESSP